MTLQEIEKLIGYSVAMVISEYEIGDYGDPDEWTGEEIITAELNGDLGDHLRKAFGRDTAGYCIAQQTIANAITQRWRGRL